MMQQHRLISLHLSRWIVEMLHQFRLYNLITIKNTNKNLEQKTFMCAVLCSCLYIIKNLRKNMVCESKSRIKQFVYMNFWHCTKLLRCVATKSITIQVKCLNICKTNSFECMEKKSYRYTYPIVKTVGKISIFLASFKTNFLL